MNLIFESYAINDTVIDLTFAVQNPQPGDETHYTIQVTTAEMQAASTNSLLVALVTEKLNRIVLATSVARRLDALLGGVVSI